MWSAGLLPACSSATTPPVVSREKGTPAVPSSDEALRSGEVERAALPETHDKKAHEESAEVEHQDPMTAPSTRRVAASCGEARPNPHAFVSEPPPYPVPPVDGTCRVCETAPEAIPGCAPGEVGQPLTDKIAQRKGARVTLAARLSMEGTMCMGVGSRCRCASKCSSPLSFIPRGYDYQSFAAAPLPPPRLAFVWPQSPSAAQQEYFERWAGYFDDELIVHCTGDEASLCCPLDFNRKEQLEDVVVTGRISEYKDGSDWLRPAIEVERICRPKVATGKSWQVPDTYEKPPEPDCTGTLSFETNVPVKVAVDQVFRGRSPLLPLTVAGGEHEILFIHEDWGVVAPGTKVKVECGQNVHRRFELRQPGYLRSNDEKQAARDAEFEAKLDALPCTGTLRVTSEPSAMFVADGRARGRTPLKSVRVAPGQHELTFFHPDFEDETTQTTFACGATRTIHMKMKTRRR